MYFVKFFALAILSISIIGCASNAAITEKVDSSSRQFDSALMSACNMSFSSENYCRCFTNEVAGRTSEENKASLVRSPNSQVIQSFMATHLIRNIDLIQERCGALLSENLSIPDFQISDMAKNILSENEGNIMTPDTIRNLKPLDKPIGWLFALQRKGQDELTDGVFKFTASSADEYFFDYGKVVDGKYTATAKYKWSAGVRYFLGKNLSPEAYYASDEDKCKLQLGRCSFLDSKGRKAYVYTEYRDGVWISNLPASSVSRALSINIYDASGLPLYRYNKQLRSGNHYEVHRVGK